VTRLGPTLRGAVVGAIAGVAVCVLVAVWVHFVFDVEVSVESDRVTIPNGLADQRFDRAEARLRLLGLEHVRTPGAIYRRGRASRVEEVIPVPGTEVHRDTTVTLIPRLPGQSSSE
jgi:hypothetical protein